MAEDLLTKDQAKAAFREAVEAAGGVCAFARKYSRSAGDVSVAYNGKADPSPSMLALAGVLRVERYLDVRKPPAPAAASNQAEAS